MPDLLALGSFFLSIRLFAVQPTVKNTAMAWLKYYCWNLLFIGNLSIDYLSILMVTSHYVNCLMKSANCYHIITETGFTGIIVDLVTTMYLFFHVTISIIVIKNNRHRLYMYIMELIFMIVSCILLLVNLN